MQTKIITLTIENKMNNIDNTQNSNDGNNNSNKAITSDSTSVANIFERKATLLNLLELFHETIHIISYNTKK